MEERLLKSKKIQTPVDMMQIEENISRKTGAFLKIYQKESNVILFLFT